MFAVGSLCRNPRKFCCFKPLHHTDQPFLLTDQWILFLTIRESFKSFLQELLVGFQESFTSSWPFSHKKQMFECCSNVWPFHNLLPSPDRISAAQPEQSNHCISGHISDYEPFLLQLCACIHSPSLSSGGDIKDQILKISQKQRKSVALLCSLFDEEATPQQNVEKVLQNMAACPSVSV